MYKSGTTIFLGLTMDRIKGCHFRLRAETADMLRELVPLTAHRSMSALADELLRDAMQRLREREHDNLERMIAAARRT